MKTFKQYLTEDDSDYFYTKNMSKTWDYVIDENVDHEQRVQFLERICDGADVQLDLILDVACGSGNLMEVFNKRGFLIHGLDYSNNMIERAKEKVGENCLIVQGDMRDFNMKEKYDLIACTNDSLNFLIEDGDLVKCFSTIKKHLKKDGLFIFDVVNEDFIKGFGKTFTKTFDDISYKITNEYDQSTKLRTATFDFVSEDGKDRDIHIQRMYDRKYVNEALTEVGLVNYQCCNEYTLEPANDNSYWFVFITGQGHA